MSRTPAVAEGARPCALATAVQQSLDTLAAARNHRTDAANRLETLRAQRQRVEVDINRQRWQLLGAGDAMAANPCAETEDAFTAQSDHLAALEGRERAIRERLIPMAEEALQALDQVLQEMIQAAHHAALRLQVSKRLLPADRRWEAALVELEAAHQDWLSVRASLHADEDFQDFLHQPVGSILTRPHLLESELFTAVPFPLARFFHSYARNARSLTAADKPTDLAARHRSVFDLSEEN